MAALAVQLGLAPGSSALRQALTHSSYAAEHDLESNERLEFLGDAVVDLAVADYIVGRFPLINEGTASVIRSRVVNEDSLADVARCLDLGEMLLLGRGVVKERGSERSSLLADAFEAVVAAVYLEAGYDAARDVVVHQLEESIVIASQAGDTLDAKTRLRRWAEEHGLDVPVYEVNSSGPSHDVTFVATVSVGSLLASSAGPSKKRAEVNAALAAWEELSDA
ncbi:MAG: ribonuclease III [Acidimicrobiaceae bacterium]|nr:ribonuclease III [Acidimicrobiaceae bacterium]